MRWFLGPCWALLLLVIGLSDGALAACCVTYTPVHVYVPPPTHVVIVPHTTFVRPVTPQAHTHAPSNTLTANASSSTTAAVQARRTPHPIIQPVVVANEATPSSTRCKQHQGGEGCKKQKDDEQTSWATVRRWLQLDKH
ncbi:MAG TPA: hypothetical protein VII40_16675 [Xanthobacteraceae bacterium]